MPDQEIYSSGGVESSNRELRGRLALVRSFVYSWLRSWQNREKFDAVETYCMFAGHARSGGSLLGGLLDAHPRIILADEVDALKYVQAGFSRRQIFQILLEKSQAQARRGRLKPGRDEKTYSYQVPGQWQGRYTQIQVIGDRKAGFSTQRLGQHPELISQLRSRLDGMRLRIIQPVRNPFDTISTMYLRSGRKLEDGTQLYFRNCQVLETLRRQLAGDELLVVRHEGFLAEPALALRDLGSFLGVTMEPEYLQACAGILFNRPALSRRKAAWSPQLIRQVEDHIARFSFLNGYAYEEQHQVME